MESCGQEAVLGLQAAEAKYGAVTFKDRIATAVPLENQYVGFVFEDPVVHGCMETLGVVLPRPVFACGTVSRMQPVFKALL